MTVGNGVRVTAAGILLLGVFSAVLGFASRAHAASVAASVRRGTLTITGTRVREKISFRRAPRGRLVVDVRDNGTPDFSFRRNTFSRIVVNGRGGNDRLRIDESRGTFTDTEATTLNGHEGADTLLGGSFVERLNGGLGNDTVDGNGARDIASMGAGNDAFVWDPGDGSDRVKGQGDEDTFRFNGSAGPEILSASSNGDRIVFTRNIGSISLDLEGVEALTVNALGDADTLTVNDLTATDIDAINVNLGINSAGDAGADSITFNGRAGEDVMSISGSSGSVTLTSPAMTLSITHSEPAMDTMTINSLSGADQVGASSLASNSILLTINGGDDDDMLVGSQGNDTINGEAGDDLIRGGPGDDTLDGGSGTDFIDGDAGIDTAANGETVVNVP